MFVNSLTLVFLVSFNFKSNECLWVAHRTKKAHSSRMFTSFNSAHKIESHSNGSKLSVDLFDHNGPNSGRYNENVQFTDLMREHSLHVSNFSQVIDDGFILDDDKRREDSYEKTEPEEYPYAVLVVNMNKFDRPIKFCSGSILTQEWVLTAAQCLFGGNYFWVYAGGKSGKDVYFHLHQNKPLPDGTQMIKSKDFMRHPNFAQKKEFDIALIKLEKKFELTPKVNTIELSMDDFSDVYKDKYRKCVTTAFGIVSYRRKSEDDFVRKTHEADIKKPCNCLESLRDITHSKSGPEHLLCAKPVPEHGICDADAGGGLVCDGKIFGINMMTIFFSDIDNCKNIRSSLFVEVPDNDCGHKNSLNLFQEVHPSLPWIDDIMHGRIPSSGVSGSRPTFNFVFSYWIFCVVAFNVLVFMGNILSRPW